MTYTATHTTTYTRTHAAKYIASGMQNVLRNLILEYNLDPTALMKDWSTLSGAIETWLLSGHLTNIIIEFYTDNSSAVAALWEFPISYDGVGENDMWISYSLMKQIVAKSARPPAGAKYRILLSRKHGAPDVMGMSDATLRSTGNLICRDAGSAIATPSMMAGVRYWGS